MPRQPRNQTTPGRPHPTSTTSTKSGMTFSDPAATGYGSDDRARSSVPNRVADSGHLRSFSTRGCACYHGSRRQPGRLKGLCTQVLDCRQDHSQQPVREDRPGVSAQKTVTTGRPGRLAHVRRACNSQGFSLVRCSSRKDDGALEIISTGSSSRK